MIIREATEDDLDALVALNAEVQNLYLGIYLSIEGLELTVWDFNKTVQEFFSKQGFQQTRHFMALAV